MGVGLVVIGLTMVAGFGGYVIAILSSLEEQNTMVRELEEELRETRITQSILSSDHAELVYLTGPEKRNGGAGRILWDRERRIGILSANGRARPLSGKEYRLWVVAGGKPSESTFLPVSDAGTISMIVERIPEPVAAGMEMFIVTVEPEGSSGVPSGTLVLAGSPAR